MTTINLVDPELRSFFESFPTHDLTDETLPAIRESLDASYEMLEAPPASVVREEISIPGVGDLPDVPCFLYRPNTTATGLPAYLHMHGGGMIFGSPRQSDARCINICERLGAIVLSVGYRLAPEHPYPAALHDCHTALSYLHDSADVLGVDRARIAIGGASAGGGLAASLAIFALGTGDYPICHQHLVFPMLDDRTGQVGVKLDPKFGEFGWTPANNKYGWDSYLGKTPPGEAFVPACSKILVGLPPVWIAIGDLDLFYPENTRFAERLADSGVAVTLSIYGGAPHGFCLASTAKVSQKFERDFMNALSQGLGA